jgi:aldehyde dehydrogenase (NAD+)
MHTRPPFDLPEALARAHALRDRYTSGTTLPYAARRAALRALRDSLRRNEQAVLEAVHADMRKPAFEGWLSEVGLVLEAIDHTLHHLREWMRPTEVSTPLALMPAQCRVVHRPLGVVLIVAPWNYPVLLMLAPLVAAISAGNCAVIKPSEKAPRSAMVVERIIADAGLQDRVSVVQGPGVEVVPPLVRGFRFDHIFFTGSRAVGTQVAMMAAEQLVPVTLELGGKSPAIVDRDTNVRRAAKRIIWGKCFNAGQTCVSPDHALVHADVMDDFITACADQIRRMYGDDPKQSPHFARIIDDARFAVLRSHLDHGTIRIGGQHDASDRYIAPTVLTDVPPDAPPMQQEIFGPILPVIPWRAKEEVVATVQRNPTPLACYIFSKDERTVRYFHERIAFGGGCVDRTLAHLGASDLPFGGVGTSGMGRYHGRYGFATFSHAQAMVEGHPWIEANIQYPPYTATKYALLRRVLG